MLKEGGTNGLSTQLRCWCSRLSSELPGGQGTKGKHRMGCEQVLQEALLAVLTVSPCGSVLGQQLGPLVLRAAWEQSPQCGAFEGTAGPRRPAPRAPRSRLVQREKDLSAYNWNSFGLRYGRRRAAGGLPTPR